MEKSERTEKLAELLKEIYEASKSVYEQIEKDLAAGAPVEEHLSLIHICKAIGKQLTCVFVDHGLMRKDEGDEVEKVFDGYFDSNFIRVNAGERFLSKLKGVTDPEQKRKIIGEEFIRVFEDEARKIGKRCV